MKDFQLSGFAAKGRRIVATARSPLNRMREADAGPRGVEESCFVTYSIAMSLPTLQPISLYAPARGHGCGG
jgi:hypothetical protein